jgi:hypothetical protein
VHINIHIHQTGELLKRDAIREKSCQSEHASLRNDNEHWQTEKWKPVCPFPWEWLAFQTTGRQTGEMLEQADKALYLSKEKGRNWVTICEGVPG